MSTDHPFRTGHQALQPERRAAETAVGSPMELKDITQTIQRLLAGPHAPNPLAAQRPAEVRPVVFVIDDNGGACEALSLALESDGMTVRSHPSCEDFLESFRHGRDGCLLVDAGVSGIGCLELIRRLADLDHPPPVVVMTGEMDVSIVVKALKAGVSEFVEKPVDKAELLAAVRRGLEQSHDSSRLRSWQRAAADRIAGLTQRQRQIMVMILNGVPNKNIAADLGLSQRTVESHRAAIMRRTHSKSLPELAWLALATGPDDDHAASI